MCIENHMIQRGKVESSRPKRLSRHPRTAFHLVFLKLSCATAIVLICMSDLVTESAGFTIQGWCGRPSGAGAGGLSPGVKYNTIHTILYIDIYTILYYICIVAFCSIAKWRCVWFSLKGRASQDHLKVDLQSGREWKKKWKKRSKKRSAGINIDLIYEWLAAMSNRIK